MFVGLVCHMVPSFAQAIRDLGIFYYWHIWDIIPVSQFLCTLH